MDLRPTCHRKVYGTTQRCFPGPLPGAGRTPHGTPPPPVGGGCHHGYRSTSLSHGTARPAPDLRTHRRHRRVGDAGGRRQGEGAQGRRPPRDRVRRGRTGLPDARPDRRRRAGRVRGPEEPPLHPRRRPARAAGGRRGEDEARQRPRGHRRPGADHQRRQAGRLPGIRHPARPRRRGDPAGAVLDHLPRGDHPRGWRARCRDDGPGRRLPAVGRAARGRPHPAHEGAAVVLAVEPDGLGRLPRADRGDRTLGRRARRLGRHRRDLRAPRLRRRRGGVDAGGRAGARATRASCSTASRRPTP